MSLPQTTAPLNPAVEIKAVEAEKVYEAWTEYYSQALAAYQAALVQSKADMAAGIKPGPPTTAEGIAAAKLKGWHGAQKIEKLQAKARAAGPISYQQNEEFLVAKMKAFTDQGLEVPPKFQKQLQIVQEKIAAANKKGAELAAQQAEAKAAVAAAEAAAQQEAAAAAQAQAKAAPPTAAPTVAAPADPAALAAAKLKGWHAAQKIEKVEAKAEKAGPLSIDQVEGFLQQKIAAFTDQGLQAPPKFAKQLAALEAKKAGTAPPQAPAPVKTAPIHEPGTQATTEPGTGPDLAAIKAKYPDLKTESPISVLAKQVATAEKSQKVYENWVAKLSKADPHNQFQYAQDWLVKTQGKLAAAQAILQAKAQPQIAVLQEKYAKALKGNLQDPLVQNKVSVLLHKLDALNVLAQGAPPPPAPSAKPAAVAPQVPTVPPPPPPSGNATWEAVDAAWAANPPQLTLVTAKPALGGAHPKQIWKDASGQEWLFKPMEQGKQIIPWAEEVAYKIGRLVKPQVEVHTITLDGKFGSLQKMAPNTGDLTQKGGNNTPVPMTSLTAAQVADLQSEQVVDWLVSNHDAHAGQFLKTPKGLVGIDKAQAYKFLGADELSMTYHPNQVEKQPIYNDLMQAVHDGKVKLDPAAALPAIKAAEAISDDALVNALKPYIEHNPYLDTGQQQSAFLAKALARKNNIRADFEKLYGQVLNQPGFKFETTAAQTPVPQPVAAATAKPKAAAPPPAPVTGPAPKGLVGVVAPGAAYLDQPDVSRVLATASKAGSLGTSVRIDLHFVEDQLGRVFEQQGPTGEPETVVRIKLHNSAAETKLLNGIGALPKATGAAAATPDSELVPIQTDKFKDLGYGQKYFIDQHGSKVVFTISKTKSLEWAKGETDISWTYPIGAFQSKPMSAADIAALKSQGMAYKAAVEAKRKALAAAEAKSKTTVSAKDYDVKVGPVTVDQRTIKAGQLRVTQRDGPFYGNGNTAVDGAVRVDFHDGARMRYSKFVAGNSYSQQGYLEVTVPGKATPETVEAALGKINRFGVDTTTTTPADREWLYLHQHAYLHKLDQDPAWVNIAAIDDVPKRVDAARAFWNKRLGVADVRKIATYNPEGVMPKYWKDTSMEAGQRYFERFDISLAEVQQQLAGKRLMHADTGDNLPALVEAMAGHSGAFLSTQERNRLGIKASTMSQNMDMGGGGANYFYTSQRTANDPGKYYGHNFNFVFKPELVLRLDMTGFSRDSMGQNNTDKVQSSRTNASLKQFAKQVDGSNEANFKSLLPFWDYLDEIRCADATERKKVLETLQKHGFTKHPIDGRPLEKFVVVK